MSAFTVAATDLTPLGFTVLPLIPANAPHGAKGKAPGEFKANHWSGMPRWQRFRDVGPDAFTLGLWNRWPDANAGIVLGTHAGDDTYVVALDFDASDPDVLDDLLRAAPASSMVKRGQKGETRFYRAAKSLRSKPYDGPDGRLLDVLTGYDTRQTVVPPSIHPATGQPYVWLRGPVPAADLPVLSEADMEALEEALEGAGWARGGRRADRPVSAAPVEIDDSDPFSVAKVTALANLNKWVPALDLYDLRPARGGYEAVATWRPSSSGRPLEQRKRNLSIQSNGIKDFGTNETYSAIDLVMVALDLDEGDALLWLEERLGLIADVVIDLRRPVSDQIRPVAADIEQEAPVYGQLDEFPAALATPPGLVGDIAQWICDSARTPQPGGALLAALTLVGTAAGRVYAGPTRSATHLYALFLAPSGAGKDHPVKCISRILNTATMGQHLGPSQFMSMSALIKRLTRQPLTLSGIDEFGSFLGRINGRKASPHEKAITGVLRTAWGTSFDTLAPPEWAGQVGEPIHSPALSLYGVSTQEEFFSNVEGADVFNGFLNRFLMISTLERAGEREPLADRMAPPDSIIKPLNAIYSGGDPLARATSHNLIADAPMIEAKWEDEWVLKSHLAFAQRMREREDGASFYVRTAEMGVRLATIVAIGRDHAAPVITLQDLDWAHAVALWSADRMRQDAEEYMAETQVQAEAMRVLRVIRRRGRCSHSELLRALGSRIRARDLKDILSDLVDSERIVAEKVRGSTKPVTVYRAP